MVMMFAGTRESRSRYLKEQHAEPKEGYKLPHLRSLVRSPVSATVSGGGATVCRLSSVVVFRSGDEFLRVRDLQNALISKRSRNAP